MQIPLNLCLSMSIQNYIMPKIEDVTAYIFYICLLEEHLIDPRDIISLCQLFNNDIRKILNQLQFRLLKLNKNTKKNVLLNKNNDKAIKKEDKVVVIDLDEDDNNNVNNECLKDNDDKKSLFKIENNNLEMTIENLNSNSKLDKVNDKYSNEISNLNTKQFSNEVVMEHLSLDLIMGIDLNLINIYNYYLRHHMRPDLALVHIIPEYVLLTKYEQLQYQFEEMNKEENKLFYYSLNKLHETEVQQLTSLNYNYNIELFDEWSIQDRGGVLTWLIKYKKSSRKSIKNENNSINDLLSPSSSVMSSPGLRPASEFICKSK